MAIGNSNKKKVFPTITKIRRSQIISTYGIGSLIPIDSESFIMLGQDEWDKKWVENEKNFIIEPEFAKSLGVTKFITPPAGDAARLPVRRFPEWVSCATCHRLAPWHRLAKKSKNEESGFENYCRHCNSKTAPLVTSRFVSACSSGHIQDFPYYRWVHKEKKHPESETSFQLFLEVDAGDESLRGMSVRCSCGARRTMENSLGRGTISMICGGESPWLPAKETEDCQQPLHGLQRGATRVWQADMRSAISIAEVENPVEALVYEKLGTLEGLPESFREGVLTTWAQEAGYDPASALEIYKELLTPELSPEPGQSSKLLAKEYEAFLQKQEEIGGGQTFVCLPEKLAPELVLKTGIQMAARVPRLKEIRALTGFSRVDPIDEEESKNNRDLMSSFRVNWLPAIEAYGEGIFLKLDPQAVQAWESTDFAIERAQRISSAGAANKTENFVTPRKLLIHSLSHALLNQLALITGYPASSIRERLYTEDEQTGILLYTSTSDSAGSLGGLCSQGSVNKIVEVLYAAIDAARWCSADPVCIDSGVHGVNNRNLAACHYCMLAPEVSCDHRNSYLDRACLVGTPDPKKRGLGFFSNI